MGSQRISSALAMGALMIGAGGLQTAAAEDADSGPFSANVGVVSNYLWRGQTQTDNKPAIQGGLDFSHASGFHAGVWSSNVDFGEGTEGTYELDGAIGFGKSVNDDFSYDFTATYIAYPGAHDIDFAEIGASATYKWLNLGINYTFYGQADDAPGVDDGEALYVQGDLYYRAALNFDLPYNLGLSLFGGYYDFKYNDGGNDYGHWGLSISRAAGDFGTFSLNCEQIARDTYDDDPKVWVGWKKVF